MTGLVDLTAQLEAITAEAGYDEMYGYQLSKATNEKITAAILTKFLEANGGDVAAARKQLVASLQWRKEFNPLKAAYQEEHDPRFAQLGVITAYASREAHPNTRVTTWNLYGASGGPKELFADLDAFLRWRVGLMERATALLVLEDPKDLQMVQVHDYKGVKFTRMLSEMRDGTRQVVSIFQQNYPELLLLKFFVNVPTWVAWVYKVISRFSAPGTVRKFHMLNDGDLAEWLDPAELPKAYGGVGPVLQDQRQQKVDTPEYGQVVLQASYVNEVD